LTGTGTEDQSPARELRGVADAFLAHTAAATELWSCFFALETSGGVPVPAPTVPQGVVICRWVQIPSRLSLPACACGGDHFRGCYCCCFAVAVAVAATAAAAAVAAVIVAADIVVFICLAFDC